MYMSYLFKILLICFVFCISGLQGLAQDKFHIIGKDKSFTTSFKLVHNLIVMPIDVNGSQLNFLLDTGVENTIMFNLSVEDSLRLRNIQQIRLRGLGEGDYIDAIKSTNNLFKLGKIANGNHMIYLIPGEDFDLTSKMGININGIIGGDLFKDFIIEINYSSSRIKFNDPAEYKYKNCKKCQTFELEFYKNKPYIDLKVKNEESESIDVKLLVDLGGSDVLWLFDKSNEEIELPEKYFHDYLGKGLSGNIYGKRSKINRLILGDYEFTNVNVAFPDSSSVGSAYEFKDRNGSLGSGILKRFHLIFDYPGNIITFKRTSKYFSEPFLYNMSGIELSYGGTMLVQEKKSAQAMGIENQGNTSTVEVIFNYVYTFKQAYRISLIRAGSPADKAGLLPNDILLEINRKPAYNYKLEEILHIFSTKEGKRITLLIERNGKKLSYSFELEKMF